MVKLTESHLLINRSARIPLSELQIRASRSSGPGGQHANKTESRIEASLDIAEADSLGPRQKSRLQARYGEVVRAIAQDERSQTRNRELALTRLGEKIEAALRVERRRVATAPSKASKERRLKTKAARAEVKSLRRKPSGDE